MNKTLLGALIAGLCSLPVTAAWAEEGKRLQLTRSLGGHVDAMVVSEPYAYVPTGRVLTTWSYADPAAPVQVGAVEHPARGRLTGVAQVGDHLYASWQTGDGSGGVAVYSLADPARPALINEVRTATTFSQTYSIAAANGHLFLFDGEYGVMVGSLEDPAAPVFTPTGLGIGVPYARTFADGHWIHAFGKNFLGSAVLTSFDVGTPQAPREAASFVTDGIELFALDYQAPFAVGFGLKLSVLDLSDPDQPLARGSVEGPIAAGGLVNGDYAYGVGFDGLDVWQIADPDQPVPVAHIDIDTLATDATANVLQGALLVTRTDRLVRLDTAQAAAPQEQGSTVLRGSVDAYDAAQVGDTVLFLQQNYGLAIAEAETLAVFDRYEFDLPRALQARAFNDMQVDGGLAYLAAWGYGLLIADVSNPRAPVERGRADYPGAHTVALAGGYAYLAKNTDGTELAVADVADPALPNVVATHPLPYTPAQLEADGKFLYIAAYPEAGALEGGGLHIAAIDGDPVNPSALGHYERDCRGAFGVVLAEAVPVAYVACSTGLHIVDVSDPSHPVRLGYAPVEERHDSRINLAVRGDRAWYGNGDGVYEFDIADPRAPYEVGFTDLAGYGPVNVRTLDDGRVLALTGIAGVHVFEAGKDGGAIALANHRPVGGLTGQAGTQLLYKIEVPRGTRELRLQTSGGSGNVSLYAQHGFPPTQTVHDARSTRPRNSESILIRDPRPGTWYLGIVGETAFERVSVQAGYR